MLLRTTFALDEDTMQRIRGLAKAWGVSQAEVVRRAVRLAAEQEASPAMTASDVVEYYTSHAPPRSEAETRRLIDQMRSDRQADDDRRGRGGEG